MFRVSERMGRSGRGLAWVGSFMDGLCRVAGWGSRGDVDVVQGSLI